MTAKGLIQRRIVTCLAICLLLLPPESRCAFLMGGATLNATYQNCSNEGQQVEVALVADNPCITCMCKEGHVQCRMATCPSTQGCYLRLHEKTDKCCDVCKGCDYNGIQYSSGTEWTEPSDPCQVLSCHAGVVTRSSTTCHPQCEHPLPPRQGECCPRCKGCLLEGKFLEEGQSASRADDPCVHCRCNKGTLICLRKSCPVLSCPPAKAILKPGSCCPECQGKRKVSEPRGRCLLGDKFYSSGSSFKPDACTNCTCIDGTSVCNRVLCPPVPDCPQQRNSNGLVLNSRADGADACCPKCRTRYSAVMPKTMELAPTDLAAMRPLTCSYRGTIYQNGSKWSLDPCTQCECIQGEVRCSVQQCPVYRTKEESLKVSVNKSKLRFASPAFNNIPASACPPGHHPVKEPGQCCPKCVEDDAVCTVFGDPHYRTFDGRVFNYQGACKYLLTSDCKNNTFSVRVTNDARTSRSFSWTKTVTLMIEGLKVTLGQHMKVKVNHKKVSLPFVSLGVFSIVQEGYSVVVRTNIGVKLLWDGESFLEVTVPPAYKGRLCGLCGNYNGKRYDDLRLKNGQLAKSIQQFGASWKVGGMKSCSRPDPLPTATNTRTSSSSKSSAEPSCQREWDTRIRAVRECNALKSLMFSGCHKKVSPVRFFKSCLLDMCECPPEKQCYCEALTAYSHECGRQGFDVDPKWREMTACIGHHAILSHSNHHAKSPQS